MSSGRNADDLRIPYHRSPRGGAPRLPRALGGSERARAALLREPRKSPLDSRGLQPQRQGSAGRSQWRGFGMSIPAIINPIGPLLRQFYSAAETTVRYVQ